jgi:ribosome biogenesis protein UTP30
MRQRQFKPYEARRELMRQNDLFLADERILETLPKLLGREWLEKKRSVGLKLRRCGCRSDNDPRFPRPPIPVNLVHSDIKAELERAVASTYLYLAAGSCLTIKLGSLHLHSPDALLENLLAVVPLLSAWLPFGGWDNIQALHVKTSTSVSLPVWNCELGEEDRFKISDKVKSKEEEKKAKGPMKVVGEAKEKEEGAGDEAEEKEASSDKRKTVKPKSSGGGKAKSSTTEKVKGLKKAKAAKPKIATKT